MTGEEITSAPAGAHREPGHAPAKHGLNLVVAARPYFGLIVLATMFLAIYGVYAMLRMPCGIYPEVAFPRISIVAHVPGLAATSVEVAVTRPIEEAVGTVLGVRLVRSKSVRGASEVNIDFTPGIDMVQALNDVRAKIADINAQFPPATSTLIERQTPSVFPIISLVVTGECNSSDLYNYAYYDLRPRISRIDDVSYAIVQGGDIREIILEVDPQRLVATGLSIADVADRVGKDHRLRAVGRLDSGEQQIQVLVNSQAGEIRDLEQLALAHVNGQTIRVADVGKVVIGHEDRTSMIRSNGKNAVAVTIFRRLKGDALAISKRLDELLPALRKSAPPGIEITSVYDQGQLVRTSIANVRDAMIVGGAFSVLILLLFLRSLRATILTAVSIPLSLIITFVFLYLTGDTLNLMSLGGLAVAIGLIIDDSVVVVENIARHLAEGQSGDAAIDRASREISGAVIGSTLTTILVFLPLAFVHGVVGQFFQSLSLSLSVALLVSMVVSLTVIPVLASRFLANRAMPTSGPVYRVMADVYEHALRLGLRWPRLVIGLALLAVVPGWFFYERLHSGFMPEMDEGAFVLDYFMPAGTSLTKTDEVAQRIDQILSETKDVSGYLRRTGAENGIYATEMFRGDIEVALKPPGQRRPLKAIFDSLDGKLKAKVPEARIKLTPLIRDQIDDLNGISSPVEVKIFGPNVAKLRDLAEPIGDVVEKAGLKEVDTHVQLGNPDLVVRPNRTALARLGLTEQDVENQLNAALYGQIATTLPEQDRITGIRVRYPDRVRYDREHLKQLPIALSAAAAAAASGPAGKAAAGTAPPGFVMLGQVATLESKRSPNALWRENQQPVITVSGEGGDDEEASLDLGKINRTLQTELAKMSFPNGYRWELAGEYRAQQESFASLLVVLLAATALVFQLLGFQFKSLSLPLLIFLSQPISLASALGALWITGTPLNVSSFMGAILLIGLDVKNGIILIEYIGQLRAEGSSLRDALVHAGRIRFRPILMTSLATILGLLPLAFGFGPGAQMQQPLAIAVIGGLTVNMLITRLLIPVGYLVLRGR
jgi:CzcA family heavy metal efflux pump